MSQRESFMYWAYNHSNPSDKKYSSPEHSSYVTSTGSLIFLIITWLSSRLLLSTQCMLMHPSSPIFGYMLLIYLIFMIVSRYTQNGSVAIYQFLWACNQSLLVGAIAMIAGDSHLLRASIVVVSVDQLLWYIDIATYLIRGKFLIGVAKYIIWPETTKLRLITTFHHVWYIPLVLWLTAPSVNVCGLNLQIYWLSCVMSLTLALIGRVSTPKQVIIKNDGKGHHKKNQDQKLSLTRTVYLNLNLSWQLWKDVKIGFFTKCYQVLPQNFIPVFLSMFWSAGSLVGYFVLLLIEKIYS